MKYEHRKESSPKSAIGLVVKQVTFVVESVNY